MAKYTVEVRHICEEKAGLEESVGFNDIDNVLDECWDKIFTTQAEFFDEAYRAPLCKKILKHFWMREIGFETVGQWQYYLNKELEEQMPMFNQLYKSTLLKFPIFNNMHIKTEHTKENEGKTTDDTDTNETSSATVGSTTGVTNHGTQYDVKDTENNMTGSGTDDQTHETVTHTEGGTTSDGTKDTTGHMEGSGTEDGRTTNEQHTTGSGTDDTTKSGNKSTSENTTGNTTDSKSNTHNDTTTTDATKTFADENWDEYSDTPQGALNNIKSGYDSSDYLSEIRKKTDDSTERFNETVQNNGGYSESGQGTSTGSKTGSENWGETDNEKTTSQEDTNGSGTSHTDTTTQEDTTGHESTHGETTNYQDTQTDVTDHDEYTKKQDDIYHETSGDVHDDQTDTVYHEDDAAQREEIYAAVGTSHDLEDFVEFTRGKTGTETFAEMLLKFRDTFRNLDMELINKFEDLFMQLW